MFADYIELHLHELTPTRPLIIQPTNVTITIDDFNAVAGYRTLGEVLVQPAIMELVVADLSDIANDRWRITK